LVRLLILVILDTAAALSSLLATLLSELILR
jgi:hypothetical protein